MSRHTSPVTSPYASDGGSRHASQSKYASGPIPRAIDHVRNIDTSMLDDDTLEALYLKFVDSSDSEGAGDSATCCCQCCTSCWSAFCKAPSVQLLKLNIPLFFATIVGLGLTTAETKVLSNFGERFVSISALVSLASWVPYIFASIGQGMVALVSASYGRIKKVEAIKRALDGLPQTDRITIRKLPDGRTVIQHVVPAPSESAADSDAGIVVVGSAGAGGGPADPDLEGGRGGAQDTYPVSELVTSLEEKHTQEALSIGENFWGGNYLVTALSVFPLLFYGLSQYIFPSIFPHLKDYVSQATPYFHVHVGAQFFYILSTTLTNFGNAIGHPNSMTGVKFLSYLPLMLYAFVPGLETALAPLFKLNFLQTAMAMMASYGLNTVTIALFMAIAFCVSTAFKSYKVFSARSMGVEALRKILGVFLTGIGISVFTAADVGIFILYFWMAGNIGHEMDGAIALRVLQAVLVIVQLVTIPNFTIGMANNIFGSECRGKGEYSLMRQGFAISSWAACLLQIGGALAMYFTPVKYFADFLHLNQQGDEILHAAIKRCLFWGAITAPFDALRITKMFDFLVMKDANVMAVLQILCTAIGGVVSYYLSNVKWENDFGSIPKDMMNHYASGVPGVMLGRAIGTILASLINYILGVVVSTRFQSGVRYSEHIPGIRHVISFFKLIFGLLGGGFSALRNCCQGGAENRGDRESLLGEDAASARAAVASAARSSVGMFRAPVSHKNQSHNWPHRLGVPTFGQIVEATA